MTDANDINSIYAEYNTWFKEHVKSLPVNKIISMDKPGNKSMCLRDVKKQIDEYFDDTTAENLTLHVSKHRQVGKSRLTFIMPGCTVIGDNQVDG